MSLDTHEVTQAVDDPRYGNFVEPRGFGVGRVRMIGGLIIITGMAMAFLCGLLMSSLWVSLGIVIGTTLLVTPLLLPGPDGRHLYARWFARKAFERNKKKGRHLYLPAVQGPADAVLCGEPNRLPGLLHDSELLAVDDGRGGVFGAVVIPHTGHIAVPVLCDPEGSELVDKETINFWVASYGGLLAELGHEPNLAGASVTVETAPNDGAQLKKETQRFSGKDAPAITQEMMAEIAEEWPATAPDVRTWVTFTWTMNPMDGSPRVPRETLLAQIADRLPGLCDGISNTGGGDAMPMTPDEITNLVAQAYSPRTRGSLGELSASGEGGAIPWSDAGPSAGQEEEDHIIWDDYASMVAKMTAPPNSPVANTVMEGLLQAHQHIERKRVTTLYRPHPVHEAGEIADKDVRNAKTRATTRKGEIKATHAAEYDRAKVTAADHAAGAGLTRFAILVTATVPLTTSLDTTKTLIRQLGLISRVRLHVCRHTQAASFAAGLGVGIVLAHHTRIPATLRDNL